MVYCVHFIWSWYWRLLVTYALTSILLAFLGVTVGLRRFYVKSLLAIFSWARKRCAHSGVYMEEPCTTNKENTVVKRAQSPAPNQRQMLTPEGYGSLIVKSRAGQSTNSSFDFDTVYFSDIGEDVTDFAKWGMEVIVKDEVTNCFDVEELPCWNLMTRTDRGYTFVSWRLTFLWLFGVLLRFGFLFPARLIVFIIFLIVFFTTILLVGWWPSGWFKDFVVSRVNIALCRIVTQAVTLKVTYHNDQFKATNGSICVANHTNFLDFAILGSENNFAIVGQKFRGFQGKIQRALSSVLTCIWFERASKSDRAGVRVALEQHIEKGGWPILLFPEGVCVSSSRVMRFRKGSFELGAPIFPVAIKYDRLLGEPFYFQDSWYLHLFSLMTSWAIKADVYYLPEMRQRDGENSIEFARRVKEAIAEQGEFVDIDWEGELKYIPVREEKVMKVRELYSERLRRMELYFDAEE